MAPAPALFNRQNVARHLRSRPQDGPDFVTGMVLDDLAQRLATISRAFENALILAPQTAHLPSELRSADARVSFRHAPTLVAKSGETLIDPENLALDRRDYDLIVSLFDLAIIDDVPGFLRAVHRHLLADGLFMAAFIGGSSFNELRRAWLTADSAHLNGAAARVAPFIGTRDAGALLQGAGFALPVADIETHLVRYASPMYLMVEIKTLGASNPLTGGSGLVTPTHLQAAASAYSETASDPDGRVRTTLELVWISGWAPHESQQKPLKPGSAKVSLKDVLKPSADG